MKFSQSSWRIWYLTVQWERTKKYSETCCLKSNRSFKLRKVKLCFHLKLFWKSAQLSTMILNHTNRIWREMHLEVWNRNMISCMQHIWKFWHSKVCKALLLTINQNLTRKSPPLPIITWGLSQMYSQHWRRRLTSKSLLNSWRIKLNRELLQASSRNGTCWALRDKSHLKAQSIQQRKWGLSCSANYNLTTKENLNSNITIVLNQEIS